MIVKFFATYRDITRCKSVELPPERDIAALLRLLEERWPALREKLLSADGNAFGKDAIVLVNGRHAVHLQGLQTPLTDSDTVAVFPVVAGG